LRIPSLAARLSLAGRFAFLAGVDARTLLFRMSLLSYGDTQRLGGRGGESGRIGPPGEARPMADRWARAFAGATPETLPGLIEEARAEFDAWIRRPLAPDTTETWEELAERIVTDAWGITADECAVAMRCTPSMVRRARLAEMRHPETGYSLPVERDVVAWARALDDAGLTLGQIETLTGVPKTTLHDRLTGKTKRPATGRQGNSVTGREPVKA